MRTNLLKISLWGLRNSGKTLLLSAFLKGLARFGKDLNIEYNIIPTTNNDESYFHKTIFPFLERGIFPKLTRNNHLIHIDLDCKGTISNKFYSHKLNVFDTPGEHLDGYKDEQTREYFDFLSDSEGIIIVLDKPLNHSYSLVTGINQMQRLLLSLDGKRAKHYVAVCLSKADAYFDYKKFVEISEQAKLQQGEIIRKHISKIVGEEIITILESTFDKNRISYFLLSSVGWTRSKTTTDYFPNQTTLINQKAKIIYNSDQWQPHNILEVFFWLIDMVENKEKHLDIEDILYTQHLKDFWKWKKIFIDMPSYQVSFEDWQNRQRSVR